MSVLISMYICNGMYILLNCKDLCNEDVKELSGIAKEDTLYQGKY